MTAVHLQTGPRRARPALTIALLALVGLGSVLGLPAQAQSPIIQGWLAANTACKAGHSGDPKAQKACARRDEIGARLKRKGCEYHEDGDWWRCQR